MLLHLVVGQQQSSVLEMVKSPSLRGHVLSLALL